MKITLVEDSDCTKEIIIRCPVVDQEIQRLLRYLDEMNHDNRICAYQDGAVYLLQPQDILYAEVVDDKVYLCTRQQVYSSDYSLTALVQRLEPIGFFRCSKAMAVNLHAIASISCGPGGRIIAVLSNNEKIIISRHYSAQLRRKLLT